MSSTTLDLPPDLISMSVEQLDAYAATFPEKEQLFNTVRRAHVTIRAETFRKIITQILMEEKQHNRKPSGTIVPPAPRQIDLARRLATEEVRAIYSDDNIAKQAADKGIDFETRFNELVELYAQSKTEELD